MSNEPISNRGGNEPVNNTSSLWSEVNSLPKKGLSTKLFGNAAAYLPLEELEKVMDMWPKPKKIDTLIKELEGSDIPLGLDIIALLSGIEGEGALTILKPELAKDGVHFEGMVYRPTGDGKINIYPGSIDSRENRPLSVEDIDGNFLYSLNSVNELLIGLKTGAVQIKYGSYEGNGTDSAYTENVLRVDSEMIVYLQRSKGLIAENLIHSPFNTINALRTS